MNPLSVRCACQGWYLPPSSSGTGPGDSDYIGLRVARQLPQAPIVNNQYCAPL